MRSINAAKVLIIAEEECLTLRHSLTHPLRPHENDIPGGIVENDEMTEQGLAREVLEETGVTIDPHEVRLIYTETEVFKQVDTVYFEHLYVIELSVKPEIELSWEHDAYEWKPLKQVAGIVPSYQRGIAFGAEHGLL